MFSRKKPEPPKKRTRDLSQFGLMEIPDDFDPAVAVDDNEDDSDLEKELAELTSSNKPKPKLREKPTLIPTSDLDKMIAESLRDVGSDEEISDDENDPELLGELQALTGETDVAGETNTAPTVEEEPQIFLPTTTTSVVDIIKKRMEMYKIAEEKAKASGEAGKARRFNRGLKTLTDMFKQATAGKNVNIDDIPPELSVKSTSPAEADTKNVDNQPEAPKAPTRQAPSPPKIASPNEEVKPVISSEEKPLNPKIVALNERKMEYKVAALGAKRAGDIDSAKQFVMMIKQFDAVIKSAESGQEVDLSDMPPHPSELKEFLEKMNSSATPNSTEPTKPPTPPPQVDKEIPADVERKESLVTATTLLEALQQRLEKYKSVEEAAKNEGNSSKARRFGRIVKQYEDAVKKCKAGKPVPIDELPTPPGFGPLPGSSDATTNVPTNVPTLPISVTPKPSVTPPPSTSTSSGSNTPVSATDDKKVSPLKPSPQKQELTSRISGNQVSTNLAEKQMQILIERQREFKIAAIEAKKSGEIEQAKEYLKIFKGFEGLLNAATSGLPVDLSTLPIPPSQRDNLEDSFAIVNDDDCDPNDEISDIHVRLEEQLAKQLMMCKNTRDHHKAMGDIAGMNRFENLALTVQKDLDLVRYARRKKVPIPKFHYEQKSFNIVHCNTDLTDNELEINVVRGIQYNVPNPKDVDTYVKVEFPYPQDDPSRFKTQLVKDTDSPDYDQKYKVELQRSNRQCQRLFKRQAVKFEIFSRGCCLGGFCRKFPMCCFSGFLRSDILIGTINVKLQPLETKCEIHDTFDLMDGRKLVGGKLEIKVRVRNPILTKQIEHINEKWLVLDS